MNAKSTIRKILFAGVWILIGGGMLTLLLAAISRKNKGTCEKYVISITGDKDNLFIDNKDVEQLLMKATNSNIKGVPVASFKLHDLEAMLEHNSWINEAELYFDNRDVLHVIVTEKTPVARIFTSTGNSFYIDSAGRKIPLSDKLSARVPVLTNVPEKKKLTQADSSFNNDITRVANFVSLDPFWSVQVAQIDITPEKTFEMIPLIGNHVVKLGSAENIEKKFRRLMVFYEEVLRHTGFDKYKVIDVRFNEQVVASRFAGNPKVDSIQLKKNVENLLRLSLEAENDTVVKAMPVVDNNIADNAVPVPVATVASPGEPKLPTSTNKPAVIKSAVQVKKPVTEDVRPKKKETKKQKPEEKTPKAVMPPKVVEDENGGYN